MRSLRSCIICSSSSSARSESVSGLACSFMSACLFCPRQRDRFNRIDDGLVAGATAIIARNVLADAVAARHAAVRQKLMQRRSACPACSSRIAAHCGAGTPPARSAMTPESDRPSMVSTSAPSHCTARTRQPRTTSPSSRTVQAPQTPCSQPICVPVSERSSRRKSTSVLRTSTRAETSSPFTRTLISRWRTLMQSPGGR